MMEYLVSGSMDAIMWLVEVCSNAMVDREDSCHQRTVTDPEDSLSCHTETIATSRPIFPRFETLIIN